MVSSETFSVGQRIACDGFQATITYVGEIKSQEGLWLGVEWDNVERGKHSGSYEDVTYFQTSVPNAGSFIRPKKAEVGISCPSAIRMKYGKQEPTKEIIEIPQKKGKQRVVEMVGFQKVSSKQSEFHKLKEVVVSSMMVNGPGLQDELKELIPNVASLDISSSLLSSWAEVFDIVCQLPLLRCLIISKNRLKIGENGKLHHNLFENLRTMILNNMQYNWDDVLECATMWPNIDKLSVCHNRITFLKEPFVTLFSNLKYLDLEGNSIGCWQEICKLGTLSSLEELQIDRIDLLSIEFPDVHPLEKTGLFPNLHSLSVRHNKLSKWQDISELNKLRNLKDLKITNNPIMFSIDPATARQLVIAKISRTDVINRTEVTRSERRGAEIDYIKRFFRDWMLNGGLESIEASQPSLDFLSNHATYIYLLKKHGVPEMSEVALQTVAIKNNLLTLEIFSSLLPDNKPVLKKLPASMPVRRLKALIHRVFNVPSQEINLFCLNSKDSTCRTLLDNDLRQLSFYSISEGDKIEVVW